MSNHAHRSTRTAVLHVSESKAKFNPPVWASISLIVACSLFIRAGFWQLDRGDQKRQLFAAFDGSVDSEILDELVTELSGTDNRYRRIEIAGAYDTRHQILLDSMMHKGRPGYHVLTQLRTDDQVVLVNRGWVAADRDRSVLPEVAVTEEKRRVSGRLDSLPRPGVRIESPAAATDAPWPRRLLFPTIAEIADQLGNQPYEFQLLLDADEKDGFVRDWRPTVMGPERHVGYAVQWFGLALTLVVIYIVVNMKRRTRNLRK